MLKAVIHNKKMILYKYSDIKTAMAILSNKKFRYTQPIAFNDPFEVSPVAESEIETPFIKNNIGYIVSSHSLMESAYRKTAHNLYKDLDSSQRNLISFEKFKEIEIQRLKNEIQKKNRPLEDILFERIKTVVPDFTSDFFNNLPNAIGSSTGVLCLSKCPDDILMWSHYANSHFGVVIEIDTSSEFFTNLKEVTYDIKRPSIDVNKEPVDESEKIKYANDIFFTKSVAWEYEKEYRDVKRLANAEITNQSDKRGFPIVLFEYPISIIKAIIFGSKMSEDEKVKYTESIRNCRYDIKFKDASLDKSLFKINIGIRDN